MRNVASKKREKGVWLAAAAVAAFLAMAPAAFAANIVSVPPFPPLNVNLGTPYSSIGLPTSTVASLSNSDTLTLPILWDFGTPVYNPAATGTYAFSGSLFTWGSTTNTSNIKAALNVNVGSSATSTSSTTSTSSPQATTSTSASIAATSTPSRSSSSSSSGMSGHRRDVSSLISPLPNMEPRGQVLGTSTSALPYDITQNLMAVVQQLIGLIQSYASSISR